MMMGGDREWVEWLINQVTSTSVVNVTVVQQHFLYIKHVKPDQRRCYMGPGCTIRKI